MNMLENQVYTLLQQAKQQHGQRLALYFDASGESFTFEELADEVMNYAGFLKRMGLRKGQKVALMLPNVKEFPLFWLASGLLGIVVVPLNNRYQKTDAAYILEHAEVSWVVTTDEYIELLKEVQDNVPIKICSVSPESKSKISVDSFKGLPITRDELPQIVEEEIRNIQYTSGTTGYPKGCVLTHDYWQQLAEKIAGDALIGLDENDRLLTSQPFYYMDPQWNVQVMLTTGCSLYILDRFSPSTFWEKIVEYQITFFYCLGNMPVLLMKMPIAENETKHALRTVACSAIPVNIHAALEERFQVSWREVFGMTESGFDIVMPKEEAKIYVGTSALGRPTPDREVRILNKVGQIVPRGEKGEIALRGKGMMLGYYRNKEATNEVFQGGWLHTGDLGRMDEKGVIHYAGRVKDMIRRSGENIAANEVEGVLHTHPAIQTAAVVPVADEIRGEEMKAFILLKVGESPNQSLAQQIATYCASHLAAFKVPRYWEFVDLLPTTPSERVAKHLLEKRPLTFILDNK